MAKEKYLFTRMENAKSELTKAKKSGSQNRINAAEESIKNLEAMAEDDYDYGKFKGGGEAVPAKFKGFSKLPEKVQQKMDPELAEKYEKGGAVGSCRGMGAAMRGGKFSGVK